jgi:hypothetical protein
MWGVRITCGLVDSVVAIASDGERPGPLPGVSHAGVSASVSLAATRSGLVATAGRLYLLA